MNSDDLGGQSPIHLMEPTTENTQPLEPGEEGKTKILPFRKITGEISSRAAAFTFNGEYPRLCLITDIGSFYVKITDTQVAMLIEDGSKYIADKIRKAEFEK